MLFDVVATHYLSDFLPIDTKTQYGVRFDAMSIGKVPSKGYFMIDCYN